MFYYQIYKLRTENVDILFYLKYELFRVSYIACIMMFFSFKGTGHHNDIVLCQGSNNRDLDLGFVFDNVFDLHEVSFNFNNFFTLSKNFRHS